ncbi:MULTISPECIES: LmeA family phospholipid-binding protein [unclassified Leifsonia]|uniref:LmeA family phospholipid-binding protein n=1 Tax=unclassified Leifsonia TaxID=2663824 RepID=UPI000A18F193|nr:DUF2993 domain-containing protein [Leifsonia sp. NCR5]
MTDTQATEVIVETARPPKRRRTLRLVLWIVIPIVVLVGLFFVADAIVRQVAQQRISAEVEKSLPAEVKGDVSTSIGGVSVLQQYLSGRFEKVVLDAPALSVNGSPIHAKVTATGVPADFSKPVQSIDGALTISQSSLNKLVTVPGVDGDLALGKGTISYDGTASLLGLPIGYQVTVSPEAAGKTVNLLPVDAKVTTGAADTALDLSTLVKALTNRGPIPVCVAQYLPDGVLVNDIAISKGMATVTLNAQDFVVNEKSLKSKGSC